MLKRIIAIGVGVTAVTALAWWGISPIISHVPQGITVSNAVQDLGITAKSAFLMEANSGKTLFAKDEHKRLPIASMVKITTLAVIFDALQNGEITMADKVTASDQASGMGGSQAFLDRQSEYTVEQLVKSIIVASANDSSVAMAEHISGSESEFVNRMNELAARLGMENTNYVNCTGLPAANSYSSAADVAKVYAYLMKSPFYNYKVDGTEMNKVWMYDLTHPSGRVTGLTNTNRHARFFNGVLGGKTGFTSEAGHCIAVAAERGSIKPIAVIIGAKDSTTRFHESGELMNHVFDGYINKLIVDSGLKLGVINLKKSMQDKVEVFARENFFDLVKKGDTSAEPTVTVEFYDGLRAPIKRDTPLGKIIVTDEGVVVREIDIVSGVDIDGMNFFDSIKKVTRNFKLA